MSAVTDAWSWGQRAKVEHSTTFLILLALSQHASPGGECFPSRKRIAKMVGLKDKGSVTRHINTLIELELVERAGRFTGVSEDGKKYRQTSNRYRLRLEVPTESITDGDEDPPTEVDTSRGVAAQPPLADSSQGDLGFLGATPPPSSQELGQEPTVKNNEKKNENPTASGADPAQDVWDHYDSVFPGSRGGLTTSRRTQIEKGLKDFTVAELCLAVDGLKRFRATKQGDVSLSAIFKTRPGGSSFSDQVAWWISQAPGSSGGGSRVPSADRAIVAQRQQDVQRGHRLGTPQALEKAEQAEAWLRRHGIITERRPGDGYPTFRTALPGEGRAASPS